MKPIERIIVTIVCFILHLLMVQQSIENQYGDNAIAQGSGILFLPLTFGPVLFAAVFYKISRWRFYAIAILVLLSLVTFVFTLVAYVFSFWPIKISKMKIKEKRPEEIPDQYFNIAAEEVKNNVAIPEVLAKSFALSGGDKEKAISIYIKYRAEYHFKKNTGERAEARSLSDKADEINAYEALMNSIYGIIAFPFIFLFLWSNTDYYKSHIEGFIRHWSLTSSLMDGGRPSTESFLSVSISACFIFIPIFVIYTYARFRVRALKVS